jgi:PAS domain-containing protein
MSVVCNPGVEPQEVANVQLQPAADQLKIFNDLLQAVSAKLLIKIRELDRASGDLRNLLKVSPIPAIFIDESLRIREFTPAIKRVWPLSVEDVGRSLLEFTEGLDYPELKDDLQRVAETGETVERYIERYGGQMHYSVRIMPNFCRDNSLGGATVTFTEILTLHSGRA